MPGFLLDAPVGSEQNAFDSFRATFFQGEQSIPKDNFDAKGNTLYRIPKRHEVVISGTLVARHYELDTNTGSYSLLEERGPFDVSWFFDGLQHVMDQHFRIAQDDNPFATVFGSSGGSYAKTDTHSSHPGWSYSSAIGSVGELGATSARGRTVVSSVFPAEILAWGRGVQLGIAPAVLGAADVGFRSQFTTGGGPPTRYALQCIAVGVGTFTAITSVASKFRSSVDYIFEFTLKDATAVGSLVT